MPFFLKFGFRLLLLLPVNKQNTNEDDETKPGLDEKQKRKYIQRYYRKCLRMNGVKNVIAYNNHGVPKHSSFSHCDTIRAIGLFDELLLKVKRAINIICPGDQFVSIRMQTHKFEIFIAADLDDMYFVIFQKANGNFKHIYFIWRWIYFSRWLGIDNLWLVNMMYL